MHSLVIVRLSSIMTDQSILLADKLLNGIIALFQSGSFPVNFNSTTNSCSKNPASYSPKSVQLVYESVENNTMKNTSCLDIKVINFANQSSASC